MRLNHTYPLLGQAGSLRLTLVIFIIFVLCILVYIFLDEENSWLIATPLMLFVFNLGAAIFTQAKFRQQLSLLTFHLALMMVVVLAALGELTRLKGQAELTEGEWFTGNLSEEVAAPLHNHQLDQVRFRLSRFEIDYSPGPSRDSTRAYIGWLDEKQALQEGVVGDHRPFISNGYRFYTTRNKGFAPTFRWRSPQAGDHTGSIHLPAYPANQYQQALSWQIPGTAHTLWTQLDFDEELFPADRKSQFRAPTEHRLIVRVDGQRHELTPGGIINFPDGTLHYVGLRTWMGFLIYSNWTLPWLFAAGLVAVLSLGWHYWRKFAAKSWLHEETN